MLKTRVTVGLLALSLFLLFVNSCIGDTGHNTVVIYKAGTTEVQNKEDNGAMEVGKRYAFHISAFVGGEFKNKEFLAVISSLNFWDTPGNFSVVGVVKTSYGEHKQWTAAEIFTSKSEMNSKKRLVGDFTAIIKGNKIYVLATCREFKNTFSSGNMSVDDGWEPLMFVGTIENSTNTDMGGVSIKWETGKIIKNKIQNTVTGAEETQFFGGAGNGIVTKNNTLVFPIARVQGKKFTSSIMYSTDDGSTWHIGGVTEFYTYDSSVVEWGDGKLLLTTPSTAGHRKVFESDDFGTTWKESLVLSRVWGNDPNRSNYGSQGSAIKVPVDEGEMLLFSHTLNSKKMYPQDTLQLWLSDGKRIVCVGTISDEEKEESSGHSILVNVGNHLYVTHEINPYILMDRSNTTLQEWDMVTGFTPLPEFFESAKTTARAWRNLDTEYKTKGVPTEGLVGFLGSSKDEAVWEDMYNCMNATVNGGKSVIGGFQFDGKPESGAQWPVASQGQNQVYIFTKKQFTLSATVIIHTGKETGEFSLIGASSDSEENNVLLGLGYTHDNKWIVVSDGNEEIKTTEAFTRDKEYHVALTFANGAASVYVDSVNIAKKQLTISPTASISHFYMGGVQNATADISSSCTVKNVMLFNSALEEKTIFGFFRAAKDKDFNKPTLTAKPTIVPKNGEEMSEKEVQKALNHVKQKITKGQGSDNKGSDSLQELRDAALKKDYKVDSSAMVSLSSVGFLCFFWAFILLSGA